MKLEHIFLLLGGLGTFLFGVRTLSDNMEKLANRRIKALFQKTSKNPFVGIGIGAVTTAIVQSSGLTTVMIVGFVNAGLMTLYQATAFIMGANIGTTVTAQIAALQSFDISTYAIALSAVGMAVYMTAKNQKIKSLGLALASLGLIFTGLGLMSDAMNGVKESPVITDLLRSLTNPILLLLVGVVLTALIQSSAAVTTIVISLASAGIVVGGGGNAVLYIILGSNIGSCITSLLSSIGASTDAKRASLIHLLFNVFGSILFFIVLVCWKDFMDLTFAHWFAGKPGTQIAMFHTFFNFICTLVFLPIIKVFVWIAKFIVKDGKKQGEQSFIDVRFLSAPTVAIEQANKETLRIADIAMSSLTESFDCFINRNTEFEEIFSKNNEVYDLSRSLTDYLVQISAHDLTINDEKRISILHNNNSDIVRLSEIADNFTKYTDRAVREDIKFSNGVKEALQEMFETLTKLFELTKQARTDKDRAILKYVDEQEDKLDGLRRRLISEHIDRLNRGECAAASSSVYINLVSNLERAGDHLGFIAHTIEEVAKP